MINRFFHYSGIRVLRRGLWLAAAALVLTGVIAGCGDDVVTSSTPQARTFVVVLQSPSDVDGAILFDVMGGAVVNLIGAFSPAPRVYTRSVDASTTRVAVVGNIAPGGVVTFEVTQSARVSDYSATVLEVADRSNELRELAGYSLIVDEP
jgi:hypothetical protein